MSTLRDVSLPLMQQRLRPFDMTGTCQNPTSQDVLPPSKFLADIQDGAVAIVTVWAFEKVDALEELFLSNILCSAAYGYPEEGEAVLDKCIDLYGRLTDRVNRNEAAVIIEETIDVDGIFWKLTVDPDGYAFQGASNPADLGG